MYRKCPPANVCMYSARYNNCSSTCAVLCLSRAHTQPAPPPPTSSSWSPPAPPPQGRAAAQPAAAPKHSSHPRIPSSPTTPQSDNNRTTSFFSICSPGQNLGSDPFLLVRLHSLPCLVHQLCAPSCPPPPDRPVSGTRFTCRTLHTLPTNLPPPKSPWHTRPTPHASLSTRSLYHQNFTHPFTRLPFRRFRRPNYHICLPTPTYLQ